MTEDHDIHEALEAIWSARELDLKKIESIREVSKVAISDELLESLARADLAEVKDEALQLTPKGEIEARQVIRRHRLAERLLHDILNMEVEATEEYFQKFGDKLPAKLKEQLEGLKSRLGV